MLGASGDRERMAPSTLWWMLNEQPVANWTAASWKEWIVRCVHLRGDQHTEILRKNAVGGAVAGLKPHHPDCVNARYWVNDADETRLAYDIFDPITATTHTVDQDDMQVPALHRRVQGRRALGTTNSIVGVEPEQRTRTSRTRCRCREPIGHGEHLGSRNVDGSRVPGRWRSGGGLRRFRVFGRTVIHGFYRSRFSRLLWRFSALRCFADLFQHLFDRE
jgi:hypothetical protein